MPCRREPSNSSVRPARKPAVFAASFQPLGAAASFRRGKRAKKLYFHTVSKTCVAPKGSYSAIFGCLVETLLIAWFFSRKYIVDELNWGVRYRLKVPVERHSLPRVFPVLTRVRVHAHYKNFWRFLFSLVDTHPRKTRNFAPSENFPLYGIPTLLICTLHKNVLWEKNHLQDSLKIYTLGFLCNEL